MVSHDAPTDSGSETLSAHQRQQRALRRLDDGHAALLDALEGLSETDAFLGSRWSVWEVMQHLLTESFVEALEQIASGEREMLPAFDARTDRIAADVAKLEANYRRFRNLISSLTEEQLDLPATPYNPENNYPALSLLDLIERVSGHEGNHARQVVETRKYVAAFRSADRAVTVAGLGTGDRQGVPTATRELLSNADYVIGSQAALAVAHPWIRAVELELRPDNQEELVNRLVRDIRAGLWSMVVTLGDPAESAPGLIGQLDEAVGKVSMVSAPGFYRLALELVGLSPLDTVCASVERIGGDTGIPDANGRMVVILGAEPAGSWREAAAALIASGIDAGRSVRYVANLSGQATIAATTLRDMLETEMGDAPAEVDSALILNRP